MLQSIYTVKNRHLDTETGETWSFVALFYYLSVCIRITFYFIIHFKKTFELFAHFYHHLQHSTTDYIRLHFISHCFERVCGADLHVCVCVCSEESPIHPWVLLNKSLCTIMIHFHLTCLVLICIRFVTFLFLNQFQVEFKSI